LVAPDGPRGLAFRIQGIGEPAPRRAGIFIYAKRGTDGSWQPLYIGESDNLRSRLAFNEIAGDAILLGASDVHIRELSETPVIRRELVDRLIATNAPLLNSDERVRLADATSAAALPAPAPAKARRKSQVA
jgi:hypothetical protein